MLLVHHSTNKSPGCSRMALQCARPYTAYVTWSHWGSRRRLYTTNPWYRGCLSCPSLAYPSLTPSVGESLHLTEMPSLLIRRDRSLVSRFMSPFSFFALVKTFLSLPSHPSTSSIDMLRSPICQAARLSPPMGHSTLCIPVGGPPQNSHGRLWRLTVDSRRSVSSSSQAYEPM